ncbi:MAG: acyl carrier protein [Clostridia bacterium]|jgi:acyl carrier protein|nr:acyl carrier protein [Clostridia bacterium]MBQ4366007.1 acyl carrier protein [Clostridia bacterium]
MDTLKTICDVICTRFDLTEASLGADTTWEEIGADSIDLVDLISELEEKFDVSIPDEAIDDLRTVGDVARLIDEL